MKLEFIVLFILSLILIYSLMDCNESFVSSNQNTYKPYFDYLFTNGKYYILFNSKMIIKENVNPLYFENLEDVRVFEKKNNLKKLQVSDLVVKKNNDDPTVGFERQCSKKMAFINSKMNSCLHYSEDQDTLDNINMLYSSINEVDKDLESCQVKLALEDNENLGKVDNEIKFMSQFF